MAVFSEKELRRQILNFMKDFKELMGEGYYFVKDHHKNLEALKQLGITTKIRDSIILSLALEDYSSGPNPDEYHPGQYWVFGRNVTGIEVYIKLKIVPLKNGNENALCLSFHPSEYPLTYPLR